MESLVSETPQRIAITGGNRFLSGLLIKRLTDTPTVHEIHVLDVKLPDVPSGKIIFHRIDLTRDGADSEMAKIMSQNKITTLVHAALYSGPQREAGKARELESIGTFQVLNAAAEAGLKRLIVFSDTFVYGAHPGNPNFISEKTHLRVAGPGFVRARVDVEKQIEEFANDYKDCEVCVLRFAPILGPTSDNVRARYFTVGLVPKVMGYDPLLQFIHEEDALRAALLAIPSHVRGVFNIVGKGVLPLSTGIHMAGKIPLPVVGLVCRTVFSLGYSLRIWDLSPGLVPFYQYLCVCDGSKAKKQLSFQAEYSSRQALKSMIEAGRLREAGFSLPIQPLGEDSLPLHAQGFERVL
jgi:UDP-glucose 4-epimerase